MFQNIFPRLPKAFPSRFEDFPEDLNGVFDAFPNAIIMIANNWFVLF